MMVKNVEGKISNTTTEKWEKEKPAKDKALTNSKYTHMQPTPQPKDFDEIEY